MRTTWDASLQDLCGRIPWGTSHLETLLLKNEKHIKISKKQYSKNIKLTHSTHMYVYIYIVYLHIFGNKKQTNNKCVCMWVVSTC